MPKTLLLADDSVTIQKVVGISFANEDVTLITVDNGNDALDRARETRPDVVLADVVMPGKNGYEVCEAIKSDEGMKHIPVLLLTGTFEAFDEERARRAGADGHITKPFEAQTLVDQVNALFAKGVSAAPPAPPEPPESESSEAALPEGAKTVVTGLAPAAPSGADEAFDFFDDVDAVPAGGEADVPEATAFSMDQGESAFDFAPLADAEPGSDTLEGQATTVIDSPSEPTAETAPGISDQTVAFSPESSPVDPPVDDDPESSLGDTGAPSLDTDEADSDAPTETPRPVVDAPAIDPAASIGDAADSDFEFGFDEISADDTAEASRPERPLASEFGSDDLSDGAPLDAPNADDISPPERDAVETLDAQEIRLEEPEGEPIEVVPVAVEIGRDPAPESLESPSRTDAIEPIPAAVAATPEHVVQLTPDMRDSVHETLEKVVWEAFADIPETLVRQIVERVEAVAWEVIPQMAETLIREEIRKLKG